MYMVNLQLSSFGGFLSSEFGILLPHLVPCSVSSDQRCYQPRECIKLWTHSTMSACECDMEIRECVLCTVHTLHVIQPSIYHSH